MYLSFQCFVEKPLETDYKMSLLTAVKSGDERSVRIKHTNSEPDVAEANST